MLRIVQSEEEVYKLLDLCVKAETEGYSKYHGMTYEQGVKAGIDWLTTEGFDHPLDEE